VACVVFSASFSLVIVKGFGFFPFRKLGEYAVNLLASQGEEIFLVLKIKLAPVCVILEWELKVAVFAVVWMKLIIKTPPMK
jgi:hypothetical protein